MKLRGLLPYRWEMVGLLWVAFFLHQADRAVYNVVLPALKADLGLTDEQLGLVVLVFTWIYGVLVPLAGYAGDVVRRKWIICGSLLFWSTTTVFTGLSRSLGQLITLRGVSTGAGEAFYYPAANSLIGQIHHKTRALAMGIHQTANYAGLIAAGLIAGYIADHYGWREAFYLFGSLGVLWSLVLLVRLRHAPRAGELVSDGPSASEESDASSPPEEPAPALERVPLSDVLREVLRKPTFWVLCLAFGGHQFAMIGFLTWIPTFLHEQYDLSLAAAGFWSMASHHVAAMIGVLIGGRLSDRWALRRYTARMETEVLGLLLGVPFIYIMGSANQLWACYLGMTGFGLARGIYDSNLFAAQFDVIPPRLRSSSVGLMLAFGFIVGGVGPYLLGWVKHHYNLAYGISLLSFAYLLAGICMWVGLKLFFARDYYREFPAET